MSFRVTYCRRWSIALVALVAMSCAHSSPKKSYTAEDRARMWVEVANGSLTEGDPVGALQALAKADQEGVDLPETHHTRALAYFARRDPTNALVEAKKAVAMNPKFSEAQNTLGKLLIDAGDLPSAVHPLTLAAGDVLYRSTYKPLTNLGILYYRLGRYPQARVNLDRAIESNPLQSCIARYYRGHVNLRESRVKEAIRDYDLATHRLCADFADAHLALGVAYQRDHDYDQARRKFLEIEQRYPNTPVADQAMARLRNLP